MLSEAKSLQLIRIYCYVSDQLASKELQAVTQRLSPNCKPVFTDAELITLYLFVMQSEQRFQLLQIHRFADNYLRSWFPQLPSYQACNHRLNQLSEAFKLLVANLLEQFSPEDCFRHTGLMDSLPIKTCSAKRHPKVALEVTDKGYCSTKNMYYYGLKLHLLGWQHPKTIPYPEYITITPASVNDLTIFRQDWDRLEQRMFVGDKIYQDKAFEQQLYQQQGSVLYSPVKAVKDKPKVLVQRDKAANDLFSKAVSTVRQPIESLFNWLIEKTGIQTAAKVRSTKGLLVHVFAKLAAAYICLIF